MQTTWSERQRKESGGGATHETCRAVCLTLMMPRGMPGALAVDWVGLIGTGVYRRARGGLFLGGWQIIVMVPGEADFTDS